MMDYSIFYSWQSDWESVCNRAFIRRALDDAAKGISADVSIEDSPRVDSGLDGIAGTPEVASIMFDKIKKCAIFVGDMSLVGTTDKPDTAKRIPNPNVLLEMGYAAGTIGWGRIICVMNEHFGTRSELPFDVRNRRYPINYTLDPHDETNRSSMRTELANTLKTAISTVIQNEYELVSGAVSSLDVNCLNLMTLHGKQPSFPAPDPRITTLGGPLDTAKFTSAVLRLLDLRLLKSEVSPEHGLYAYHWTYLGIQVLQKLRMR